MTQQPKYRRIVDWVKSQVESGAINPGEKLNSENELAEMFQMSRQTVRHAISELEKEKIIERRQGSGTYISNVFKRRTENTMNIAVVTTYVDDYIFPSIIKGMEEVISDAGYTLQIAFTHNSVEKEYSVIKNILDRNMADGIIVEPTKSGIPNPNVELYNEIIQRDIPTIFFNSNYPQINLPYVVLDDRATGYKAAKYLIEAGHTRIAGIFKSDDRQGHLRYAGYVQALADAGLRLYDENVLWIDTEDLRNLSYESKRVLKRLRETTACVCYNDLAAQEIVKICGKNDIRIPEDLSIVSVDNSEIAANCKVPLTSVSHPKTELGKKVASNLIKMIEGELADATYEFLPELTERKSVKKIDEV
ncbi:GntR family transcriptional regulator [Konateibacter massiliensis]|uniref:GntR family transcriptional regulator n=1 Tax=Konateibacter massiliensis TaxID=2002841 RepID=UPI000C15BE97|nr:GntR family transcriptional regulator [Konateibacter massiliensis]